MRAGVRSQVHPTATLRLNSFPVPAPSKPLLPVFLALWFLLLIVSLFQGTRGSEADEASLVQKRWLFGNKLGKRISRTPVGQCRGLDTSDSNQLLQQRGMISCRVPQPSTSGHECHAA